MPAPTPVLSFLFNLRLTCTRDLRFTSEGFLTLSALFLQESFLSDEGRRCFSCRRATSGRSPEISNFWDFETVLSRSAPEDSEDSSKESGDSKG